MIKKLRDNNFIMHCDNNCSNNIKISGNYQEFLQEVHKIHGWKSEKLGAENFNYCPDCKNAKHRC